MDNIEKIGARDLMIDDWVYNDKHQLCKVVGISHIFDSYITLDNYDVENDGTFESAYEVEPVPLSDESLERNAFIKDENGYYRRGDIMLEYDDEDGSYMYGVERYGLLGEEFKYITNISFLHELQHIMRQKGIEK